MPLRRDFVPNLPDFSVGSNPERHAHDPEEIFPEETLHPPRAVGFDDLEFRVRQQREVQLVLDFEFRLRVHTIRAAAQNGRVCFPERLDGVAKLGRFGRSTRCIRLRVKIENQILPFVIRERNHLALVGRHAEVRSFVAFFQHRHSA